MAPDNSSPRSAGQDQTTDVPFQEGGDEDDASPGKDDEEEDITSSTKPRLVKFKRRKKRKSAAGNEILPLEGLQVPLDENEGRLEGIPEYSNFIDEPSGLGTDSVFNSNGFVNPPKDDIPEVTPVTTSPAPGLTSADQAKLLEKHAEALERKLLKVFVQSYLTISETIAEQMTSQAPSGVSAVTLESRSCEDMPESDPSGPEKFNGEKAQQFLKGVAKGRTNIPQALRTEAPDRLAPKGRSEEPVTQEIIKAPVYLAPKDPSESPEPSMKPSLSIAGRRPGERRGSRGSLLDGNHGVTGPHPIYAKQNSFDTPEQVEEALVPMKPKGMFADADTMKAQLREAITDEVYDVTNFYHDKGFFQYVARSFVFEHLTLLVISVNAIWIAVDVDLNKAATITEADLVFVVADNFFCFYFCAELFIRFMAFKVKSKCMTDSWFVFDSGMCALMFGETWILPLVLVLVLGGGGGGSALGDASILKGFRMLRLMRMARVIRLLNALPELMVLVKGMRVACRAVSCTVLLLLLVVYIFAVALRQLTDGTEIGDESFPTVPISMRMLLVQGTMPDLYDAIMPIWENNHLYAMVFLMFVLVVTLTIMNMLVGVLVGVVNTVTAVEKEQLMVHFVKSNLLELLKEDEDGMITRQEFEKLIQVPLAVRSFDQMGVDVMGLVDLTDFIFTSEDHTLTFGDFFELIMQFRGDNQATVKDIVDLRKCVALGLAQLKADLLATFSGQATSNAPVELGPEERRAVTTVGGSFRIPRRSIAATGDGRTSIASNNSNVPARQVSLSSNSL